MMIIKIIGIVVFIITPMSFDLFTFRFFFILITLKSVKVPILKLYKNLNQRENISKKTNKKNVCFS